MATSLEALAPSLVCVTLLGYSRTARLIGNCIMGTTERIHEGHMSTTVYQKPTDQQTYLHASIYHPNHIRQSIV